MASKAQIAANQANARKSSGPKTECGKKHSCLNAFKHGMRSLTIMPVLPQEDPKVSEERVQQWIGAAQPQNAMELKLVHQAAELSLAIERGERMEVAHMAGRVIKAARRRVLKVDPRQREQVRELGRRLLYIVGPEEEHANKHAPWSDDPGLFVSKLEETAAGCLWLLERWQEFRNLLDRKVKWEEVMLVRFIRLQGKDLRESIFDPALNSIYLAWDVLFPNYARTEWEEYRKERQRTDPAYHHRMRWQETGSRPCSQDEAWASLYRIVDDHTFKLKALLTQNQALEAAATDDPRWADRAAMDCSAGVRAAPPLPVGQVARAAEDPRYPVQAPQGGDRRGGCRNPGGGGHLPDGGGRACLRAKHTKKRAERTQF